jgi:hypothetical protein
LFLAKPGDPGRHDDNDRNFLEAIPWIALTRPRRAVTCSLTLGTGIDFPAVSPLRIDCDFEMYNWRHLIERELR